MSFKNVRPDVKLMCGRLTLKKIRSSSINFGFIWIRSLPPIVCADSSFLPALSTLYVTVPMLRRLCRTLIKLMRHYTAIMLRRTLASHSRFRSERIRLPDAKILCLYFQIKNRKHKRPPARVVRRLRGRRSCKDLSIIHRQYQFSLDGTMSS